MKYIILLFLLSGCAYQTAVVTCPFKMDVDECIKERIGKGEITILRKKKVDGNTYMVDYRE